MSLRGTDAHRAAKELPPLVRKAVEAAQAHGFDNSCRPEQGRLLHALAQGAVRWIAETGTGCGVGLAWLATGAPPGVRLLSVERDEARAAVAAEVFAGLPQVEVVCADWTALYRRGGPFDLLVLDGGGQGKNETAAADPERLLAPGGTVVIDDFTPATTWPPLHEGRPDAARLHWLEHPALAATELRLAPDLSSVVGRLR